MSGFVIDASVAVKWVIDEAVLAARLLARADVDLAPMRPYLEAATSIAVALDHPAYDCVYLALAVCRKIVEKLGGRIWIEDAADGGCVFLMAFPRPAPL